MRQNRSVWRHALALTFTLWAGASGGLPGRAQDVQLRDLVARLPEEPRLRINPGGHTGVVHALAFAGDSDRSDRLCSAGDKVVHVWNLSALTRDLATVFLRERTIRWQVARGPLGQIYALAYDAQGGLLALGGQAAMPPWGQIVLVEPKSGKLVHVLEGHRATLASLAFSPDGQWLASADVTGQTLLWKRGPWKPVVVLKPDDQQHGKDVAAAIQKQTGSDRSRFVAFAGNQWLVVPVYVRQTAGGSLVWKLEQVSVADPTVRYDLAPGGAVQEHVGTVTALAGSRSVVRIASADLARAKNVYLWDWPDGTLRLRRLDPKGVVVSLALSDDGRTLALGTAWSRADGGAKLQLWDAQTLQPKGDRTVPDAVAACAISPDGRQLAYGGGIAGEVYREVLRADGSVDGGSQARALRGHGRRVWKVAFAAEDPPYRVAFGTEYHQRGPNDYGVLGETFDPETSTVRRGVPDPADWLPPNHGSGDWTVERLADGTLQLARGGKPGGRVALNFGSDLDEGRAHSWCFVPDPQGNPFAIAVGTTGQNSIYVFRLTDQPDRACPVLRHFRGHEGDVSSVGVSRDLRYVVSGSVDGTVSFWSLADLEQGGTPYGSWGAEMVLSPKGDLVAARVHPAGPLCAKGVREGDVLREIRWFEGDRENKETQPERMRKTLQGLPWGTQVYFRFSRLEVLQPWFALRPAWQAMATLFVGDDGEHAFWTPAGYYDASLNGRSLFGWQINPRSNEVLPDFYRADQFKTLEKPEAMRVLLQRGSLREALRAVEVKPKADLHETLPGQIARTPKVEVLDPAVDALVEGSVARVKARVEVPPGAKLVGVNVYASGVIATKRLGVQRGPTTEKGHQETHEYEVPLPAEERTLIQVLAGTEETVGPGEVVVVRPRKAVPDVSRRLYLLAAGIDTYHRRAGIDPDGIGDLTVSVADAQALADVICQRSRGLYEVQLSIVLTNDDVTPERWRKALEEIRARLAGTARPDDLILLFLAGHGVLDPKAGRYYFVGHDFKRSDLGKDYRQCISWEDFRILADVPCRKLAILDTCHAGAIQPPTTTLKTAVRGLQDAMIFTVTAAKADQASAEVPGKHGLFTSCLLEALEGRADAAQEGGAADGRVSLLEAVLYVREAVPRAFRDTVKNAPLSGQNTQDPVAAPMELLPFTRHVPLTGVSDPKRKTGG